MFALRRSALRVFQSSPAFTSKARTITSLSSQAARLSKPATQSLIYQRRWASTEAEAEKEAGEEEAPVSKLQPTPAEEVENAIHSDSADYADAAISQAVNSVEGVGSSTNSSNFQESSPVFQPRQRNPRYNEDRERLVTQPKPTIYVGNLFFDVTEDDISREMSRFGTIKQARLVRDARGLSKGFGYIDFEATESATAAIEALHQQVFEGRRIVVQYAAYSSQDMAAKRAARNHSDIGGEPKNPPSKTLFIGNMSFEMTDRDLNNLFRGIRNVVDVRVAIDRRTGQPRGFAHADFIDTKSAMDAVKVLQEKEIYGRKLRIDFSLGNTMATKNQSPSQDRR